MVNFFLQILSSVIFFMVTAQLSFAQSEKIEIIMVGDSAVGKTSLYHKYINDTFVTNIVSTIGIDFHLKHIKKNHLDYKIFFWDTAGLERYSSITQNYLRRGEGIIILFSLDDKLSFRNIERLWIPLIKNSRMYENNLPIFIVGNKKDLIHRRVISYKEASDFCHAIGAKYFEVSALEGDNIDSTFTSVINESIQFKFKKTTYEPMETVLIKPKDTSKESCCQ